MPSRKKKRFLRLLIITLFLLSLISVGIVLFINWLQYRKVKLTKYPEFGIVIPDNYIIHGIDVSKYQELIAWEEVQKMNVRNIRLGFAFIKATEGIGNDDPQFNRNWKKAKANGIVRGAYHFFLATKDGKMQAENFIKKVELEKGDLPPVLDVEHTFGLPYEQVRKELRKWLSTVENYYRIKPIIYTNVDFYNRCLGKEFDDYPLWVAHYYEPHQPRIKRGWLFWQHSDAGRVNGIIPKVDFNVFAGDSLEFQNLLVK